MKQSFYICAVVVACGIALGGCLPKRIPTKGIVNGDVIDVMENKDSLDSGVDQGELWGDLGVDQPIEDQPVGETGSQDQVGDDTGTVDQKISPDVLDGSGDTDTTITPPSTLIGSKPDANTNQKTASFSFSCDKPLCTYQCKIDDGSWKECNGGSESYVDLDDKTHTFSVKASYQGVEEILATTYQWEVDTKAPVITITAEPLTVSNIRTATIEFSCNETPCTVNCQIDDGSWKECPSPVVLNDLALGKHSVKIQAVDLAGNIETPLHLIEWTVLGWSSVSATDGTTCAISTEGTLFCWGLVYGYDGVGSAVLPRQIGVQKWADVSVGFGYGCMIRADKTLWCLGSNSDGQLGIGSTGGDSDKLLQEKSKSSWLMVITGNGSACGIQSDNTLWCWGANNIGQLGLGDVAGTPVSMPTRVGSAANWSQISSKRYYSCGLRGNALYCWGNNYDGQVGNGKSGYDEFEKSPVKIGGDEWQDVSAGGGHTCGIKTDKTLWCWGKNEEGQLGNNDTEGNRKEMPTKIGFDTDWIDVECGERHTCALKDNGSLHCWGENGNGQLGIGSTPEISYKPEKLPGNNWVNKIALGSQHTCSGRTDKTLWCWGWKLAPLGFTVPADSVKYPDQQIEFAAP